MKINQLVNNIKYYDKLPDDNIKLLINHYLNKKINFNIYFEIFNVYNIKNNLYMFIGTFEKEINNQIHIYYVFLKKKFEHNNIIYVEYSIFSIYQIGYMIYTNENYSFTNIKIDLNNNIYKYIFDF